MEKTEIIEQENFTEREKCSGSMSIITTTSVWPDVHELEMSLNCEPRKKSF